MSSFTSGASLRRRCLVPSFDQQSIICAHGPFLESFDVSNWEQHKIDLTKQPTRLKLFSDLGAYIEQVLPLGSTGHYVAISNVLKDNVNKEFRVYASLVHSEELIDGGFADLNCRFVISSQPWNERPCAPKVAVESASNRLFVLTASSIKVFKFSQESDICDFSELICYPFEKAPQKMKTIKPLFMASSESLQFILLNESKRAVMVKLQPKGGMENAMISEYKEMEEVTAAHHIQGRDTLLIANDRELHVITTKPSGLAYNFSFTAYGIEEAILHFEVAERPNSDEKTVFALSQMSISIYRLDDGLTVLGRLECDDYLFTTCTLLHRSPAGSVDGRKYLLLAVAFDNGEVKFVDAASYMDPEMSILPSCKDDPNEIVSFFPVWSFLDEIDDDVDCLEGIYAVTSTGQFVYRTPTDNEVAPFVTKVIADDVVDMSSFTTRSGKVSLVAYGRKSIYIHRISLNPKIHVKDETSHLTCDSFISECFASSSHFLVCTADKLALVNTSATETDMRGIAMDPMALDGIHTISTYGAIYGNDGEADLQLSVIGTSNGRIYAMKVKQGELHANGPVEDIQDLLESDSTNQFKFKEVVSASFIESDNERIVSASSRWIEGRMEMLVLGVKGTLVRFSYSREKGIMILEVHMASVDYSHLSFRSLTTIRGLNESPHAAPLIVAYQTTNANGIQFISILLLELKSHEPVLSVSADRVHSANLHSSGHVHVFRSAGREWGRVTLFSLHTTNSRETTKKKTIKDSFVAYEGVLRRTCKDELVVTPVLPTSMQSLHVFSRMDGNGVRTASVIGVSDDKIIIAKMSPASKLSAQIDFDLMDGTAEPSCSGMFSTVSGPVVIVGCDGGEVLMIWDKCSRSRDVMVKEPSRIMQIAPFTSSRADLMRKGEFMFAILTQSSVSVYVQVLEEVGDKIAHSKEWKINLKGDPEDYTLYAMGSEMRHHNVWLCGKKSLLLWRGHKGRFENAAERRSLDVMGAEVTATCSIPVIGCNDESIDCESQIVDIVCVGAANGRIGWFYILNGKDGVDLSLSMKNVMLNGVDGEIKALDGMVVQQAYLSDPQTVRFGVCIYVLTAHRVTVNFVNVELKKNGLTIKQMAQHHLYHLVRDPSLLSVEKPIRPHDLEKYDDIYKAKTRRRDIPQRVVVSGENEVEVLLMCPKKLFQLEHALEVMPRVIPLGKGQPASIHYMRNNTEGTMHVSHPNGNDVLPPYSCRPMQLTRKGVPSFFTLRYRVEGEKEREGNVTVYLTEK